ncbi:MAG: D-glycero-beta-D-manno-heptose 1-phosphate adenylyltransferase [Gemmatimonadaceae bacterium]
MLDEYFVGDVDRISPEAPVPVLRVSNVEQRLGGAANVAMQIAALGAHASLAGVVGRDDVGAQVLQMCANSQIDVRAVSKLDGRPTTRKLRALACNQQLLRLDFESAMPCPATSVRWMIDRLKEGRAPDMIVLSDYAKGVLTPELMSEMIEAAGSVRTVVDPKRRDFNDYRGASIITPNLHELEIAVGRTFDHNDTESIAAAAKSLAIALDAEAIVVTCGERGLIVVPPDAPHVAIAARRHAICDTTGAGDTVVAVLVACLAAGATIVEAAKIANVAAGLVVEKVGTVSAQPAEITEALRGESASKVLGRDDLARQVHKWRAEGKRIVFTNGCFDLLHAGHLSLLHTSADLGDVFVLGVNSDASIHRLKGPERPIIPEHERAAMLASLACVDAVSIFEEDTPLETLQLVRPDILVKGQDYRIDQVVGGDLVESYGGRVVLLPLLPGKSTTALIERISGAR